MRHLQISDVTIISIIERDGRWVPTFPNAKYVFHKHKYAAWEQAGKEGKQLPGNVWKYNCEPIVEAGQALLVDDDYTLYDTVWLTPTPGQSPCHCCVNIRSGGQRAAVTGALMYHALQRREPSWSTIFDWDAKEAEKSRPTFLGDIADTGTFCLPICFPDSAAALVEAGAMLSTTSSSVTLMACPRGGIRSHTHQD